MRLSTINPNRRKIVFSWSGGKDSALGLYELLAGGEFEIAALFTTITADYDRVCMHGVRRVLLERQAAALGFPLHPVKLPAAVSNSEYERIMAAEMMRFKEQGINAVAFADLFLTDLKKYREEKLAQAGMSGIFPLWARETSALAESFIATGFQAIITCVDSKSLDRSFVGRRFDETFLRDLPPSVDPCGENGEFHSFVFAGPIFRSPLSFKTGEVVFRENRFFFLDLLPGDGTAGEVASGSGIK